MIVTLLTAVAHYLNGGIRLQVERVAMSRRTSSSTSRRFGRAGAVEGGGLLAAALRADDIATGVHRRRGLHRHEGPATGAATVDVIAILAAVLFVVNVRQQGFRLPVMAVGLWSVVAVVAGDLSDVRAAVPGRAQPVDP